MALNVDSPGRSLEADAWALLALKSPAGSIPASPGVAATIAWDSPATAVPLARLEGRDFDYIMRTSRVTIGRNSRLGDVDVNMGNSSFVSRRHVEISYSNGRFHLLCLGRNGVFVNGMLHRDKSGPIELPRTCSIRFPSTQLRVGFSSLIDDDNPPDSDQYSNGDRSESEMQRLAVTTIPSSPHDRKSSCPSPTLTISAANSCPVSPRGSFCSPNPTDLQLAAYRAAQAVGQSNETELENLASAAALVQQSVIANGKSRSSNGISKLSKPPFSYAQMIVQAITSARDKQLTLSGIYDYIVQNYPFYKRSEKGWQNSIRHNLSLNRYFVKVPRAQDGPGKGSYWRIDPAFESRLVDQAFRRRRQKGLPALRPGLATRSAPSSPTRSMFASPYHPQHANTLIHRLPNLIATHSSHLTVPVPRFFSDSAPSSPLTPRSTTPSRHSPLLSQSPSPSPSHSTQGSAFIIPSTTINASNSSYVTIQVPSFASLSQRNGSSPRSSPSPSGEHPVSRQPPPLLVMSQEHMMPASDEQHSALFALSSPSHMVAKMTDSAQSALQVMSRVAGTVSPTHMDGQASYTAEYSNTGGFPVVTNSDGQIGLVGENQVKRVKFLDI